MHCLKTIHDKHGDLNINLHRARDAHKINRSDWVELQNTSFVNNPFYEEWNLIPALKNLVTEKDSIYVATIYAGRRLIALFPIKITRLYGCLLQCTLWQHKHAFLSDPLQNSEFDLARVLSEISSYLGGSLSLLPLHKMRYDSSHVTVYSHRYQRAAIQNTHGIPSHIKNLSGKKRRELNRVRRNLEENHEITYFIFDNPTEGLDAFCRLEHKGWKGKSNGSINSSSRTKQYYLDLVKNSNGQNFEVIGLTANTRLIACAIRIKCHNHYFEIKTTYDESYKRYAPGKVLEFYILENLGVQDSITVDSCSHENNSLINWLWPDHVTVYRSHIFSRNTLGRFLAAIHSLKQKIKGRPSHA